MGWFLAGLIVGWFVPQPDWKALGARLVTWWTTKKVA